MSFRRVLVPTDFSRHAKRAAELALAIAERDNAELMLLHVSPTPDYALLAVEPMYLPPKLWDRLWEHECTQIQRKLDEMELHLRGLGAGDAKVRTTYRRGSPVAQILEAAERLEADLIVVGSQGTEGTLRYLFGGVAGKVTREAPCPVLVAPPGVSAEAPINALIAVDYSKFSAPAAEVAVRAVGATGRVSCLHVWQQPQILAEEPFAEFAEVVEKSRVAAVVQMAEFVHEAGLGERCAQHGVEVGSPAREILEYAQEHGADLIVLGSHGRHGVERVIGTVADRVLRQAETAVLLVPERALDQLSEAIGGNDGGA